MNNHSVCDRSLHWAIAALFAGMAVLSNGCHFLKPTPIRVTTQQICPDLIDTNKSQIEVGATHRLVDAVGWVVGIPSKVLLWDRRIDSHKISEDTILVMSDYLEQNNLAHIKVRANQYAPLDDWKRLKKNKTVAWPYRYTLGAISVAGETILPGRIFGGDHYNPFTDTIHLYSDVPAIALHESGHAKDFTRRTYKGTYATGYLFFPLWAETIATEDTLWYLQERGEVDRIAEANRILYPAYGTYVGNGLGSLASGYAVPLYYGAVVAGHINGRMLNRTLDTKSSPVLQSAQLPEPTMATSESTSF